ncbi:hypothetical protein, partial [Candidatus Venteria ishoeyi]
LFLVVGFFIVFKRHSRIIKKIDFAGEYRNKFIEFANKYFNNSDQSGSSSKFDNELYVWLTMNVSKIQSYVGDFGIMAYKPAYQNYMINNYQIIINTIPKFRDGQIQNFDVTSVDDCLLRYIGYLENYSKETLSNLKNPIIWFREGIREIISIPILILNWFGIFSSRTVNSIMDSFIYKILTGIIALVTLISGLVTIVLGYDKTIEFLNSLLGK